MGSTFKKNLKITFLRKLYLRYSDPQRLGWGALQGDRPGSRWRCEHREQPPLNLPFSAMAGDGGGAGSWESPNRGRGAVRGVSKRPARSEFPSHWNTWSGIQPSGVLN